MDSVGRHVTQARRSLWRLLIASSLAFAAILAPPTAHVNVVEGHCTNNPAQYVQGYQDTTNQQNGVRAQIGWVQGNICTSGVYHFVVLCAMPGCTNAPVLWMQVGMMYFNWQAEPRSYCEFSGATYMFLDFNISHGPHDYKFQYDTFDDYWDCYVDSSFKASQSRTAAGFDSGRYVGVQGEAIQAHVQIGEMAPSKLSYSAVKRRKESDGVWVFTNLSRVAPLFPYGSDLPFAYEMRAWTNAH